MPNRALAVPVILGVSFRSLAGPVLSARYNCIPPMPSMGRIATANTIMPIPPNHCSCCRYSNSDRGRSSRPAITVAPVVVRPDTDSNNASARDSGTASLVRKGTEPKLPRTIQNNAVTRKPSRIRRSRRAFRVGNHRVKPASRLMPKAIAKAWADPSLSSKPRIIGGSMAVLNSMSSTPMMRSETGRCIRKTRSRARITALLLRCDFDRSGIESRGRRAPP